jgi:hypothetical protein
VAPRDVPQSNLTLRNVHELLKDPEAARRLSEETGMSPDQIEQFVQRFDRQKVPRGAARPGEEVQVKPGASRPATPDATLPGLDPRSTFSTKSQRNAGAVVQDDARNNFETTRFVVPPEIGTGFEAYKSTLSRSRTLNPGTEAPAGGPGRR